MNRLIVYGAGELGGRVAALWTAAGGDAVGFTRTTDRHAALAAAGVDARTGDPRDVLRPDDRLLLSLPGHETQRTAVERLMDRQPPRRAVFVSTVGAYGSEPSGTITEETPPPQSIDSEERAQSILETEDVFRQWTGDKGVILRCGGLYSHDRGPFAALVRRGRVRLGPPDKTLALIHYDDAARAAFVALQRAQVESIYNAVTPPCPTRQEFYTAACRVLGLAPPTFADPLGQPPADYDVSRLRRDLLPEPAYPDWSVALERPPDLT